MTATAHALIGASIARIVPDPVIGLPLALFSHFICDKVPHWDPMTTAKEKSRRLILYQTVADVLVGYFLVFLFFFVFTQSANPTYILLSAFVAQLPDWLEIPYVFLDSKTPPFYQNYKFQKWLHDVGFNARMRAPWGVVTQLVVIALFLIWALA